MRMARLFVAFATALFLSYAARAQTVCVVLSDDTTFVMGASPCDPTSNPPGVSISTTDTRYLAYLATRPFALHAAVNSLLAAGITITFSTTTGASDTYSASNAMVQYLLNNFIDKVSIGAAAVYPVCTSPPVTQALVCPSNPNAGAASHTMGTLAYRDLFADVKAYNAAVVAAAATATTNHALPIWPSNVYTSAR